MTKLSTAENVALSLYENKIKYIFGMPGGGSSIDLIEECTKKGLKFVLTQHETTAALMAIVYGQLTNTTGVSLSIMGPGAINLCAGAGYAYWERHSLICITETYNSSLYNKMSLQKINHSELFSTMAKTSIILGNSDAQELVNKAITLSSEERPGPIHFDMPHSDANDSVISYSKSDKDYIKTEKVSSKQLKLIIDTIESAKFPLLIGGPLVYRNNSISSFVNLAEHLQCATMVTSKARGIIPENHPLFMGIVSGVYDKSTFEGQAIAKSDLIVSIGLDRMELLSPWEHTQPHIIIDKIQNPHEPIGTPKHEIYGDLNEILSKLKSILTKRNTWNTQYIKEFWETSLSKLELNNPTITATSVIHTIRKLAPKDAILTTEAGIYGRVALYAWKVFSPNTYFDSSGANTMGFSIPAALASCIARPKQRTIALIGDAGFLMRATELEIATRLKLHPIIIIFTDRTLGMIRVKQSSKKYRRNGVDLSVTNFVKIAESFGGQGFVANSIQEFKQHFTTALNNNQLTIIDVQVDPNTYSDHIKFIRGY